MKLPSLNNDIIKEARKWVLENKGCGGGCGGGYSSPRVSSEIPDCSMPLTFDQYNFCSLGCLYCFAYFFKSNNPTIKQVELKSIDVHRMVAAIRGRATNQNDQVMYEHFYKRRFLLHWGGLADPFCHFEMKNGVGLRLIKSLGRLSYPTLFSYKGPGVNNPAVIKEFEKCAPQRNFAFQCSVVTWSEELAKRIEIGVPTPKARIASLKRFSDMGYWTILRLRPFIIGISDEGLDDLLEEALAAGIRGVSMEFMAIDGRSNVGMRARYDWIGGLIGVDNLPAYFQALSPAERGGYRRLNRFVKEPYVRKVYEFCAKHDLVCAISDPDFKELNTSGSCCGMPDKYPENPELENWTVSQLTYHVKELRRVFHLTGEKPVLRFSDVYGDESYLDEQLLAAENVAVIGRSYAERRAVTQRDMLRERWNNLGSPANPRNYLHGKVMPCGVDENDDMVYVYEPMEYEARWKADGVDLTR